MTHTEQILNAVAFLVTREAKQTFSRDEIRRQIGVDPIVFVLGTWRSRHGRLFPKREALTDTRYPYIVMS